MAYATHHTANLGNFWHLAKLIFINMLMPLRCSAKLITFVMIAIIHTVH